MESLSRVLGQDETDVVLFWEEDIDFSDAGFGKGLPEFGGQRLVGFEQNFTGLAIDDVGYAEGALEVGQRDADLGNLGFDELFKEIFGNALVCADNDFFRFGVADFVGKLAIQRCPAKCSSAAPCRAEKCVLSDRTCA